MILYPVLRWVIENPYWTLIVVLPLISLCLSMFTFNVPFELSTRLEPKNGIRFARLFCGWLSLAYFGCSGLFSS